MTESLLSVRALSCHYSQGGESVAAVDGISFDMAPGEVLGLVGESGSGKSTLGRLIAGLAPKSAGEILFQGQRMPDRFRTADYQYYASRVQMVFQDSYSAMNPRMRVQDCVSEPLLLRGVSHREARRLALSWMERVGLNAEMAIRFPHELSGGQRQRVGIARALINRPQLLICDEPVSALDVSVQAQIVNLLGDIQRQEGLAMLFIAHDLAVVNFIADRSLVMYRGKVVEVGEKQLFRQPAHPYTQALLAASPVADPGVEKGKASVRGIASGEEFSITAGCRYAERCPRAKERCLQSEPGLNPVLGGGQAACFYPVNQD